ncbi:ABC transporter, partial [Streptomyces sp. NPDC048462]
MPSPVMPTPKRRRGQDLPAAIEARGLCKSYGDKVVLDGIDLVVPAGTVFA